MLTVIIHFRIPQENWHKYPAWLLLFIHEIINPVIALLAIAMKILLKKEMRHYLFGNSVYPIQSGPSMSSNRDNNPPGSLGHNNPQIIITTDGFTSKERTGDAAEEDDPHPVSDAETGGPEQIETGANEVELPETGARPKRSRPKLRKREELIFCYVCKSIFLSQSALNEHHKKSCHYDKNVEDKESEQAVAAKEDEPHPISVAKTERSEQMETGDDEVEPHSPPNVEEKESEQSVAPAEEVAGSERPKPLFWY